MTKRLPIVAISLILTLLTGCAAMPSFLQTASTVLEVPACRQALIDYLPDEQEALIADDMELLDTSFGKLQKVVSGNADISFEDGMTTAFGSVNKALEIEAAFANVTKVTQDYRISTEQEPDEYLTSCKDKITRDWKAGKDQINGNPKLALAADYLKLFGPMAIKVVVSAATGVPLVERVVPADEGQGVGAAA